MAADANLPILPPDETFTLRYGQTHVIERAAADGKASVRVVLGQGPMLSVSGEYRDATGRVLHPDIRNPRVVNDLLNGHPPAAVIDAGGLMKDRGEAVLKLGPTMALHITTDTDPDLLRGARMAKAIP